VKKKEHTFCRDGGCSEPEGPTPGGGAIVDSDTEDTKDGGIAPEAEGGKPKSGSVAEEVAVAVIGGSSSKVEGSTAGTVTDGGGNCSGVVAENVIGSSP
jgi:hypothetical protein